MIYTCGGCLKRYESHSGDGPTRATCGESWESAFADAAAKQPAAFNAPRRRARR